MELLDAYEVFTVVFLVAVLFSIIVVILHSNLKHRIALALATALWAVLSIAIPIVYGVWRMNNFMFSGPLRNIIRIVLNDGSWEEIVVIFTPLASFIMYLVLLTAYISKHRRSQYTSQ